MRTTSSRQWLLAKHRNFCTLVTNLWTVPDYACSQAKMSHTIERCEEQFHKMPNMQQNPEDKWTSDLVKIMFHSTLTLFKDKLLQFFAFTLKYSLILFSYFWQPHVQVWVFSSRILSPFFKQMIFIVYPGQSRTDKRSSSEESSNKKYSEYF